MWFRTSFDAPNCSSPRRPTRRRVRSDDRREARRLFLENLEGRSLMAFDVLAEYATSQYPPDMALTQINAGGQLDLAVLNGTGSASVRLGTGAGGFGSSQDSATGASPGAFAAGDFNGDGLPDLVTAEAAGIGLLAGNGDGTFDPPQLLSLPSVVPPGSSELRPQNPRSIATGDLNADGRLDLVVGTDAYFTDKSCYTGYYGGYYCTYFNNYSGHVNVLLGNASGGFGAPATHDLGTGRLPNTIAVGDINGDSQPDVISASGFDLSVLLGDGLGAVGSPQHSGSGNVLRSISLGDVDGDGKVDTLLGTGFGVAVQKGNGLGGFTALTPVSAGHQVDSAVMGDVNADGKLDLVVAGATNTFTCTSSGYYGCYDGYNTSTRQASVLLGNGAGGFALPLTSYLGSEQFIYGWLPEIALADLTGDGMPDLVTLDASAAKAIVAVNDADWHAPAAISILDATVTEGDGGTVNVEFTVTIVGEHDGLSIDFGTSDYSAVASADYTAKSGTLNFAASESSQTISIAVSGDALDEYDEQFFVNLSHATSGQITDATGAGTILDNDAAPLVTINDVSKNEGNRNTTPINFTVSLSTVSGKAIYVDYVTADGTATTAGSDYFATSGTLYIAPGATTALINTSLRGDTKKEANETFYVNLTGAADGTISDNQGVGTIVNDDGGRAPEPPKLRIGNASIVEGNSGTTLLVFTVSLSAPSDGTVRVEYATSDGRAKTSDNDYVAARGQLVFALGESTKTISVVIKGDTKKERGESFYVDLFNADNASISDARARGRIQNDDRR